MKRNALILLSFMFIFSVPTMFAEEASPTPLVSPSATVVATPSPTVTASPTPTSVVTASPTPSPSAVTTSSPTATPKSVTAVRTANPSKSPEPTATVTVTPVPTVTPVATFLPMQLGNGGQNSEFTPSGQAVAAQGGPGIVMNLVVFVLAVGLGLWGYLWSGKRVPFLERIVGRFRKEPVAAKTAGANASNDLVRPLRPRK